MTRLPLDVFHCPLDGTRLIEASAGTGKTWNICGLVLRLLLEKALPVEQVLVVTFTNAATAELHERIRDRIAQTAKALRGDARLLDDPFIAGLLHRLRDDLGLSDSLLLQRLDAALQTFDEASILTIHGFCQRALADAPFSAGLPLATELMADDSELRLQVVQDFWRRRIAAADLPAPVAALLLAKGDAPERHAELLKRRIAKPMAALRWPEALDDALPAFDLAALQAAHEAAQALWHAQREAIGLVIEEARARLNQRSYSEAAIAEAFDEWDGLLAPAQALASPSVQKKAFLLGTDALKPRKGCAPPHPHAFFDAAQRLLDLREDTRRGAELHRLALLRELLATGPDALRQLKRERRVVAFDDMLANLHERLASPQGTALAASLRQRFPAVLIDEFQDTDPLQFAIFHAVWGRHASPAGRGADSLPLFLVGDPKQAIYSFRNADLHTYLQARATADAEYTLAQNQRSVRGLIDGLNALFGENRRAFMLDGLDFHPVEVGAKPRPVLRDDSGEQRAPLQFWQLSEGHEERPLSKAEALHEAATACAAEIARLLNGAHAGRITLDDRPLAAGEIAVLVRSHAQGLRMRQALATFDVGSVEVSQASVFATADAQALERLLLALLSPGRERLLRAALATELLGHDAASLNRLADDEDALLDWVNRFAEDRELWRTQGIGVVLRRLMRREEVAGRLLSRPDGERRMTNLLHLAELLHEASAEHRTPEALLHWLQQQRAQTQAAEATQLRLESDRHLVQIVTIHRSKGLEYPFVFCPFLFDGDTGARRAGGEGCELHDEEGRLVLDFRHALTKEEEEARKATIAAERAAEHLRLLYVALTRAVHRCHVVIGRYCSLVGRNFSTSESERALLNWLVLGDGMAPEAWLAHRADAQALAAGWQAFANRHAPHIALAPLPAADVPPVPMQRPDPAAVQALPPPPQLPHGWRIGSYSSLAHGVSQRHGEPAADAAVADHDERSIEAPPPAPRAAAPLADDDILRFPRGAAAGDCLHAVFERIDFTRPAGWPGAIAAALRRHAGVVAQAPDAPLPAMLQRLLGDVLHTPIADGLRLADIPDARRRVELEFTLPAQRLTAHALQALLQRHGVPVPALAFGELRGYLRGFIDLVVEHDGRWHLIDWKSNHLGDAPGDYAAPALARAMAEHGYHLQALLYTVALHRHLQRRLRGYRYEQHHGGAHYLFVRGMRPAWGRAGIFGWKPARALVEALSALLDGDSRRTA